MYVLNDVNVLFQPPHFRPRLLGDRERGEEHDHDGPGHGDRDLHEGVRMRHRRNRSQKSGGKALSVHRSVEMFLLSFSNIICLSSVNRSVEIFLLSFSNILSSFYNVLSTHLLNLVTKIISVLIFLS